MTSGRSVGPGNPPSPQSGATLGRGTAAGEQVGAGPATDRPVANEDGLRALGDEMAQVRPPPPRGGPPRRPARRRRLLWTLGVLAAVIVLIVVGVAGYGWYLNHEIRRVAVPSLDPAATGSQADTENILMVGSTSRCALAHQNPAYGLCSEGVTGVNGDVLMLLHLNSATRAVSILSIPRDLFVPNARSDGANKVDAGLVDGPNQLVKSVEEDFGVPVQHYVELNFDSFANVVNDLGGINMYFPEPVFDAESGLKVLTTGCLHLNGTEALEVVRARHLQYKGPGVTTDIPSEWPQEAQSDLARIRRDHEFLRVLATAVAKKGISNPITDQQILAGVAPQLEVDSGLSLNDMLHLVLDFHAVNASTAPQLTLPVAEDADPDGYTYEGGGYGDVEFPAQPQDQQVVNRFLGVSSTTDTMNGKPLPKPSEVTVSVQNGTGAYNQATDTGTALQALGFRVNGLGDVTPPAEESETVVNYGTMAHEGAAEAVARNMSGAVTLAYDPSAMTPGVQVTVVTGTDFSVDTPAAAAPAGTSPSSGVTTTTAAQGSGDGSGSEFTSPTPSNEPLAPWDPRACTPSGGEGT